VSASKSISGFTLVELMIVVFILGILAGMVIPQFETATLEAREAALKANLVILRKAIELYRVQHYGKPPLGFEKDVVLQLVEKTNRKGAPGTKFGPYLRTGIPRNPINNLNTIKINKLPVKPDDKNGWLYDKESGEIRANSIGAGPSGINYVDL